MQSQSHTKPQAPPLTKNHRVPWTVPNPQLTEEQIRQSPVLQRILKESLKQKNPQQQPLTIPQSQPLQSVSPPLDPNNPLVHAARESTRILKGEPPEGPPSVPENSCDDSLLRAREHFNRILNWKPSDPPFDRQQQQREFDEIIAAGIRGPEVARFKAELLSMVEEFRDRAQLGAQRRKNPSHVPADAGVPENVGQLRIAP
jgi:hypothetical protein